MTRFRASSIHGVGVFPHNFNVEIYYTANRYSLKTAKMFSMIGENVVYNITSSSYTNEIPLVLSIVPYVVDTVVVVIFVSF